jgi:N-acetylglucosaminyl-diphospho-decaprenol L-rhamnosyltransferase
VAVKVTTVTIVRGRHEHLRRQHIELASGTCLPDHVVVVAMGDEQVGAVVEDGPLSRAAVVELPVASRLPLAAARNRGAELAFDSLGSDIITFLDVDCLPGRGLVDAYVDAWHRTSRSQLRLLNGPVCYLQPPGPGGYTADDLQRAEPHPARPAPGPGSLLHTDGHHLFWSLSFALDAATWAAVGGFDERYTGYGGEDTDFGQRAAAAGAEMWWVGGARAYHQWHPISDPPLEHVEDIVRNANLFRSQWGWFPMSTWLDAFAERGLAHHDRSSDRWYAGAS